jgi:hypothetical protein
MFQICVPSQNVQGKKIGDTFLNFFLNAMIRIIKIHNTFDIIEISNLWNLINVFKKINYKNVH